MSFAQRFLSVIIIAILLSASPSSFSHSAQEKWDETSVDALFLGEKGENRAFFLDILDMMMKEHIAWRQVFHPEDRPCISEKTLSSQEAALTQKKIKETLLALSARLKGKSTPWFSPRYLAHMNADVLLPAIVGYMGAMLYNANNVVYESGPATTEIEHDVGSQLAGLFGYDPKKAWGNITAGGTTANTQAM